MENRRLQTTTQTTQTNSDVTTWELPEWCNCVGWDKDSYLT